jgi:predicted nucleic acid-binding protein
LKVYADSSFIVSLYVADIHSPSADRMFRNRPPIYFTPLHFAEWMHALGQQVFRKNLSPAEAKRIGEQLNADKGAGLWLETAIPERAFDLCADLARRYGPKLGVRTLDSLHVACALEFKAEQFWTFDDRQGKLAKAEGLKTN